MSPIHTAGRHDSHPSAPSGADGGCSRPSLAQRTLAIPGQLLELIATRRQAEGELSELFAARLRRAEELRSRAIAETEDRRLTETADLEASLGSIRTRAETDFAAESGKIEIDRLTLRKTAELRFRRTKDELDSSFEASKWEIGTIFETAEKGANEWKADHVARLNSQTLDLDELKDAESRILQAFGPLLRPSKPRLLALNAIKLPEGSDPLTSLEQLIEEGFGLHDELVRLKLPRTFQGARILGLIALPLLATGYPAYLVWGPTTGLIGAVLVSFVLGSALITWVVKVSRRQISSMEEPLEETISRADSLMTLAGPFVKKTHESRVSIASTNRDEDLARNARFYAEKEAQARAAREEKVKEAESIAREKQNEVLRRQEKTLRETVLTEELRRQEIARQRNYDLQSAEEIAARARGLANSQKAADQASLANEWTMGLRNIEAKRESIQTAMDSQLFEWSVAPETSWTPPRALPPAIPLGRFVLQLGEIPGGMPEDEALRAMTPDQIVLPALLDFPERSSVMFEAASEETRRLAVAAMQSVMLRYLTGLPAGKVRFTIMDPVGLGRNFAAFMHLADFSGTLVNDRIWTEPQQIEQRLGELNLHIETVIQNYLRNEFATIEQYNEQAAEVAEPYRILVVADFPTGFSETMAKRLVAIAKSGPRCGVYLILGLDTSQPLPPGITRADLAANAVRVHWKDGRPVLRQVELEPFPLVLDEPPSNEVMTLWLHRVGEEARDANRVEVPFEVIAPRPEDYWTSQSTNSVSIPLGRSGATKLQPLSLGRGTAQHTLIAGRTGSGKSTLLHALITNAALMYHPDQLEMYLIDFKKGVEFKTYATHRLPHARVVAIESEREFGLSVLQRLDQELRTRGDQFRDLGVQDLAGFRELKPELPMPRTLFIVDEFQEFFVEDDKLAQEASLLLDRLVRQGRAFGIHVILGSQTLSGAYSLARSTLGQMAVRIALQCSEADAQLILNEDNAAARLLSRPGEAIYNDANGQSEGNHVFQVVWLPDARREVYLRTLSEMCMEQSIKTRPTIVFEGNVPSDLTKNPSFADLKSRTKGPPQANLGEAVAIKEPTAAIFRAQGVSNLLVLGQNEEMATGLMSAALLGLAAECGDSTRIFVLDGSPEDSPFSGRLESLGASIPLPITFGCTRDSSRMLSDVAAEVERRQASSSDLSPWFLFVHDLSRFRDLRKADDDFGFGRRGEEKILSPAKLLGNILRDGPPVGVHVLAWCDSLNNANRSFDRQALREFEMRVLFQMSPTDSSNVIDSPIANRLGANRALFSSEEEGKLEKFRPYGLPSPELLEDLGRRWRGDRPIADPSLEA